MQLWILNVVALAVAIGIVTLVATGALWRLGAWHLGSVEVLNFEEGLPIGSEALELAVHKGPADQHLFFRGEPSFLVFGLEGCEPCEQLIDAASLHPATRSLRLIYVSNSGELTTESHSVHRWEVYRFHDDRFARGQWRAPVSPYFHLIDAGGRVVAKGIGNRAEHLDRLLSLRPGVLSGTTAVDAVADMRS